jgi:hypothetical protein
LRVDFQASRVSSDGGLLGVRELDDRLDLTGLIQKDCQHMVLRKDKVEIGNSD